MLDYTKIPEHMRSGVKLYIDKGISPGSFLYAVLSNDFMGACCLADSTNGECLADWARFVHNELPMNCHGNSKMVDEWIKKGGMNGS